MNFQDKPIHIPLIGEVDPSSLLAAITANSDTSALASMASEAIESPNAVFDAITHPKPKLVKPHVKVKPLKKHPAKKEKPDAVTVKALKNESEELKALQRHEAQVRGDLNKIAKETSTFTQQAIALEQERKESERKAALAREEHKKESQYVMAALGVTSIAILGTVIYLVLR